MFKILIADDEAWIRERLVKTVDWSKVNVEIIAEACDGEEALEKTYELLPDIVLTDIRMPGLDGLEFVSKLREKEINTRVIIISGYDDFNYAKRAIGLGAAEYIVKPVNDDELLNTVQKCIDQIEKENEKSTLIQELENKVIEQMPQQKEKFLFNLINNKYNNKKWIQQELDYFNISNKGKNHICFIVYSDALRDNINNFKDAHLVSFSIGNIAKDFTDRIGSSEIISFQPAETIVIVSSSTDEKIFRNQVNSISKGIKNMVKKIFFHTVSIGIGNICKDITAVNESYAQAKEALLYKIYFGNDNVYTVDSINKIMKSVKYCDYDLEKLVNSIKTGDRKGTFEALSEIIAGVEDKNKIIYPVALKAIYVNISFSIIKSTIGYSNVEENIPLFDYTFFKSINDIDTIDKFKLYLNDMVVNLIDYLEAARKDNKRIIIDAAIKYINNHYQNPLTLNDVVEEIFISPSYFCKIFKQEMKCSFTKYLMKFRIERAIELLKNPRLKIYEVAQLVGYNDVQYFTKIFKSISGVSPTYYRDKVK